MKTGLKAKRLVLPIKNKDDLKDFTAGEEINLEGILYTARDKVHALVSKGNGVWPFEIENNGIYYAGPTPKVRDFPLESCGPTTSARMDKYAPELYRRGLAVTVGKGPRGIEVVDSIKRYGGLYLVAYGGCGALYGSKIVSAQVIGYENFGPQSVYKIEIKDFPVLVGIDFFGNNIFNK
jgi:fumarate hydratase subunit beta